MNLYIVTEGSTEVKLYPAWLDFYLPELSRVDKPESAIGSSYYLVSGCGYPSIIKTTTDAIETLNGLWETDNICYNYLIVFVDSEDIPLVERKAELSRVMKNNPLPGFTQGIVIVQNKCIETWFLGNRSMFPHDAKCAKMLECIEHYDVCCDDPELMECPSNPSTPYRLRRCTARYHLHYLQHMISEKTSCSYTKKNPADTLKQSYFTELVSRYHETAHLSSFGVFVDLLEEIKNQMTSCTN